MKNQRKIFAIVSIIFLVILAIAPFKGFFPEWKKYQNEYNEYVAKLPQKVKPTEIGIKQIWVQSLDRVDRCTTCHLGIKEPALKDAPQPFRTHPQMHHDIEDLGCTSCHDGQGSATDFKEAHGQSEFWDQPVLPVKYMEASCGKCHKEPEVTQAPLLTLGRKLVGEYNCAGCHKIDGFTKQWVPPLDGIGAKVNSAWLINWLKNPKGYWDHSHMPNFGMNDTDANTIADFLKTFTSLPDGASLTALPASLLNPTDVQKAKMLELGQTRFGEARCVSCHAVNGKGGYVATDLGKVSSKVSTEWLYNYIKSPKHLLAGVQMPRFRFTDDELAAVVLYMKNEFVDFDMVQPPEHTQGPEAYQKGLAAFKRNNCSGCHQLGTMNHATEMAPELSFIGSKRLYEIDFGQSKTPRTLPDYIQTKLMTPHAFSPIARMPKFGFTEQEAQAITVALLANRNENIPEKYVRRALPKSKFLPQGEFGKLVADLSCLACHTMEGSGRLVATDLSLEASQAHPDWISNYFKVPYSLRPILTERMVNLFLSESERKSLVDYMQVNFIADSLERTVVMNDSLISHGKSLYFDRYACQSCHQMEGKGGYVGPPLDKLDTRLKAGWIYHWLKDPQSFKPATIEPNNNLSDEDADAITAFLLMHKEGKP
jgi:mono/diheme cytochrome c family protein